MNDSFSTRQLKRRAQRKALLACRQQVAAYLNRSNALTVGPRKSIESTRKVLYTGRPWPAAISGSERNSLLEDGYRRGLSLRALGERVGLSAGGVWNILQSRGHLSVGGIGARRILETVETQYDLQDERDEIFMKVLGCNKEVIFDLLGIRPMNCYTALEDAYEPIRAYRQAVRDAARRRFPVAWLMTFPQWWRVWKESRLFHLRGNSAHQYCMARWGDIGPYCACNVRIITIAENVEEANRARTLPRTVSSDECPSQAAGRACVPFY